MMTRSRVKRVRDGGFTRSDRNVVSSPHFICPMRPELNVDFLRSRLRADNAGSSDNRRGSDSFLCHAEAR